jgi:hypothetical protein
MAIDDLDRLATLIKRERDALLSAWRQQVRHSLGLHLDTPTLNDHIPTLLDELAAALKSEVNETIPEAVTTGSPPAHGVQRAQEAFDIEEVVAGTTSCAAVFTISPKPMVWLCTEKSFHIQPRPGRGD